MKHITAQPKEAVIYPDGENVDPSFGASDKPSIYPHICMRFTDPRRSVKSMMSPPDFRYEATTQSLFQHVTVYNASGRSVCVRDHTNAVKRFKTRDNIERRFITIYTTYCLENPYYLEQESPGGVKEIISHNPGLIDFYNTAINTYEASGNRLFDEIIMAYKILLSEGKKIVIKSSMGNTRHRKSEPPEHLLVTIGCDIDCQLLEEDHLFVTNKNLVLSYESLAEMPDHPIISGFNPLENASLEQTEGDTTNLFSFQLVDNDNEIGPRFININGQPVKLTPIHNLAKENGFYIYRREGANTETDFISTQDMGHAKHLYKTREEARDHLDFDSMLKKSTENMQNQHAERMANLKEETAKLTRDHDLLIGQLKREHLDQKHKHDMKVSSLRLDVEKLVHEKAVQKGIADVQKAKADRLLSIIKMGGTVITTAFGVFLILSKQKK